MPDADFFAALGFFTRREFLDARTCARLRADVGAAPASAATVRTDDRTYDVDRSTRSTKWAEPAPEAVELVEGRLAAIMPEVSRHYGVPFTGVQPLQFLVYRQGDFFQRHRDRGEDDAPAFSRARRVAAVIFLNGEGDPSVSAGYRGGALTLYGLFEQPEAETLAFPLEAEEGLLVTFPGDVMHEVRPVEAGERYTVVTWFRTQIRSRSSRQHGTALVARGRPAGRPSCPVRAGARRGTTGLSRRARGTASPFAAGWRDPGARSRRSDKGLPEAPRKPTVGLSSISDLARAARPMRFTRDRPPDAGAPRSCRSPAARCEAPRRS